MYYPWIMQGKWFEPCNEAERNAFPESVCDGGLRKYENIEGEKISGEVVFNNRFGLDLESDTHTIRQAILCLFSLGLVCRTLAYCRFYIRYVWDDNVRAMFSNAKISSGWFCKFFGLLVPLMAVWFTVGRLSGLLSEK